MTRDFDFYIDRAIEAFEAGPFLSEAEKKCTVDDLDRAFLSIRNDHHAAQAEAAPHQTENVKLTPDQISERGDYFTSTEIPETLSRIRQKHLEAIAHFSDERAMQTKSLLDLREAIRGAEVEQPADSKALTEIKASVDAAITEAMEARALPFLEAFELSEIFGNLPVSINSHWVRGKGQSRFLRSFFYLNGKLVPLSAIVAAMQGTQHEPKD